MVYQALLTELDQRLLYDYIELPIILTMISFNPLLFRKSVKATDGQWQDPLITSYFDKMEELLRKY